MFCLCRIGFRDSLDDKSKANLVQKGRFSVTSGNLDPAKVGNLVFNLLLFVSFSLMVTNHTIYSRMFH